MKFSHKLALAMLALLAVVLNFSSFMAVVKTVFGAFSPVISGAVFAYLLNPLMNFMDRRLYPALLRRKMPEKKAYRLSRVLSLIFALLFALVLIYEFFSMLLPQLTESITGIFNNMSTYYADAEKFVLGFLADNPDLSAQADKLMTAVARNFALGEETPFAKLYPLLVNKAVKKMKLATLKVTYNDLLFLAVSFLWIAVSILLSTLF